MSKQLIIQLGRLDGYYRSLIPFKYQNHEGKGELSSLFLKRDVDEFKNCDLVLVFPESIALQDWKKTNSDLKNKGKRDDFLEALEKINPDEYLKNPEDIIKNHPHLNDSSFWVVSSIGHFSFIGEYAQRDFKFKNTLDRITLQIYLFLASRHSNDKLESILLDISSGQNIYIAAMLNAVYRFLPYIKFKRFLKPDNGFIKGFILNADPILGGDNSTKNIQKSTFSARAFNSLTFKDSSEMNSLIKTIFKEKPYYKALQNFITEDYFLLHGGLIFTSPLAISLANEAYLEELFFKVGLDQIIKDLESFFNQKNHSYADDHINSNLVYSLTFALGIGNSLFSSGFIDVLKDKEIIFEIEDQTSKNIKLKNELLDSTFKILEKEYKQPPRDYKGEIQKLYEKLRDANIEVPKEFLSYANLEGKLKPLNKQNLSNKETEEFLKGIENLSSSFPGYSGIVDEWKSYLMDNNINNDFVARNYFAHGGFEKNLTEIRMEGNKIRVRYNSEMVGTAKKRILKYLK